MADRSTPETTDDNALADAEVAAAREAADQAAGGGAPEGAASDESESKVARPRARTSGPRPRSGKTAGAAAERSRNGGGRQDVLDVRRSAVQLAAAEEVDVHQGAIGRADARDVSVSMGAIGFARGDRVSVEMGALGGAVAREVQVTQSFVSGVVARDATIGQALVRSVVAANVRIERPTAVGFLLARRVDGDVRALFDWRAAAAFGAVAGVLMAVLSRRRE